MISSCVKCPTRTLLIVQVTLVALVVAFVVVLVIRAKRSSLNSGRSSIGIIFARAKIVVGFYQVMTGTLDGFGYTDLPPVLTRMVEFAKFVQLNILQIAPVHCFDNAYKINSYLHMTVTLSVAIAVVVFALGYYWVRKFWKHCKQKGEEDIDEDKELCIRNVFLILFIVYPDTSGKIFRTLPPVCHNLCADTSAVNCSSYLSTDYSLACYTDQFNKFVNVAYFGLVFAIGFPVITCFLLWKYYYKQIMLTTQNTVKDKQKGKKWKPNEIATAMSFIYENYSQNCWFWEIVELVRKLLLTSVLVLIGTQSRSYIGSAAVCSGLYAILYALYKPIPDTFEYWLQMASLTVTFVNLMIGLMLKIPDGNITTVANKNLDDVITIVLLLFANFLVTAIVIGEKL